MSERVHRYPPGALVPDLLRGWGGFLATAIPLPFVFGTNFGTVLLGGLAILFGTFGVSTLIRQRSTVLVSDEGIRVAGPRPKAIRWWELTSVDLRFFSTSRTKTSSGWMELKLKGAGRTLRIESSIEGFPDIVRDVDEAARRNDVRMSETTRGNLATFADTPHTLWGER